MKICEILRKENILLNKECVICYSNLINIKSENYDKFLEKIKIKYKLSKNSILNFEHATAHLCNDERFECLTCRKIICCECLARIPDPSPDPKLAFERLVMETESVSWQSFLSLISAESYHDNFYSVEDTGVVTCPVCRTKDFRLKINGINQLPVELLQDIKKLKK